MSSSEYLHVLLRLNDLVGRSARKTVNGKYEIDPDKNDGLNFQYDSVVRDKDERRRLEAGDCECCRDVRSLKYSCYLVTCLLTNRV